MLEEAGFIDTVLESDDLLVRPAHTKNGNYDNRSRLKRCVRPAKQSMPQAAQPCCPD